MISLSEIKNGEFMKGFIFVAYSRMIEEQYGLDVWKNIIEMCEPRSKGIYLASQEYPQNEFVCMHRYLSRLVGDSEDNIYFSFGKYLFNYFNRRYPHFLEGKDHQYALLIVDQILQRNLHSHDGSSVLYELVSDVQARLVLMSDNNLKELTLGIIEGVSCYYKERYLIDVETKEQSNGYFHVFNIHFHQSLDVQVFKRIA